MLDRIVRFKVRRRRFCACGKTVFGSCLHSSPRFCALEQTTVLLPSPSASRCGATSSRRARGTTSSRS
jgi:hypothetical protein